MTETDAPSQPPAAGDAAPPADLSAVDAAELATLVANASDEQLAEGMSDPEARQKVLDEVFRRMTEHVEPAKAKGIDARLLWKITDRPDGGVDAYEVVIQDGAVSVVDEPSGSERVTFTVGPAAFLRLVSGAQAGPVLFMTGKLKIEGDLMFASQVASMFRIPKAGS